ncbi:MAG: PTS sugar transporter subunit IIC [Chloroflexota bacterium]|nr:PTS sugar transporter subunit IIC [Anaerolineae bacterium]
MVFRAILISLYGYLASSTWMFATGFMVWNRPFIAGTIVGLILGDPMKGMLVGATINLVYLGWISAGGSAPADIGFAGVIGTTVAITGNLTAEEALAIAVPVGLLGAYLGTFVMTLCSVFPQWADQYAEEGNTKGVALVNMLPRQVLLFPLRVIPIFLVVMYGGDAVAGLLSALPQGAINGLNVAGAMLPAVGVGMLLMYMGRKKLLPFFFLGYLLAGYATKDLMLAATLGTVIALIYIQFVPSEMEAEEL